MQFVHEELETKFRIVVGEYVDVVVARARRKSIRAEVELGVFDVGVSMRLGGEGGDAGRRRLPQRRLQQARQVEMSEIIDLERGLVSVFGERVGKTQDAGVEEEIVEPAMPIEKHADESFDRVERRQVEGNAFDGGFRTLATDLPIQILKQI